MIPNIHNKNVFDSEFDLAKSSLIFKEGCCSFYKVKRNSDLLDYSLLMIDYPSVQNQHNSFIQTVLNAIPMSKNSDFLEIYTIYAWEPKGGSPRIAILMEKFDEFLITAQLQGEPELSSALSGALRRVMACWGAEYCHIENMVLKSKSVKILAMDIRGLASPAQKFLLIDQSNISGIAQGNGLSQLIAFFRERNQALGSQKIALVLEQLAQIQPPSPSPGPNPANSVEISLNHILEENFQERESSAFLRAQPKTLSFAPVCAFCAGKNLTNSSSKLSTYYCRNPECLRPFCADCLKTHRKTLHSKEIIELDEFLNEEITAGESLKLLEESMARVPEVEGAVEESYRELTGDIENLFLFLEGQILKVLRSKKSAVLDAIGLHKEEDLDKVRVIEQELGKKRKELIKLRETNEVRTPYLQDELDKMLTFISEFRFRFHGEFNNKAEALRKTAGKEVLDRDLVSRLLKRNPEFSRVMHGFGSLLEGVLQFPTPFLNELHVERLRNARIDAKSTHFPLDPENARVEWLVGLGEKGFLGFIGKGNRLRRMNTGSFTQEFARSLVHVKTGGALFQKESVRKVKEFGLGRLLILGEKVVYKAEIEDSDLALGKRIELGGRKIEEIEGFKDEDLLFLGRGDIEDIEIYSISKEQWSSSPLRLPASPSVPKTSQKIGVSLLKRKDSERLFSVNSQGSIRLWDFHRSTLLRSINSQVPTPMTSLLMLDDANFCVSAGEKLLIYSTTSFKPVKTLSCDLVSPLESALSLLLSEKLGILIACFPASGLILWDVERHYSRIKVMVPAESSLQYSAICWASVNSEVLACGTSVGNVFLIDLAWEVKKNNPVVGVWGRGRSISKHSSDMTDFFEEMKDPIREEAVKDKKRKVSVMDTKKVEVFGGKRSMDDSIFESVKAKIWMGKDRRKASSICRVF